MKRKVAFLLVVVSALMLSAIQPVSNEGIPTWVSEDWQFQMSHTGIWITDNHEYKGEQEPFDAYGMQWDWGIGKKSLKGRMFCLQEGEEVATVWEFLQFWDSEAKVLRMLQIGRDGTVGQGTVTNLGQGKSKSQERFCNTAGQCFEVGHETWKKDGDFYTQSFDVLDGEWSKRRLYVWKQKQ